MSERPKGQSRLVYDKATRTIRKQSQQGEIPMDERVMSFNNGLSPEEDDKIDDLRIAIVNVRLAIEALGRHRSYSLAVTKLEEAEQWLRDRKFKPA